MATAPFTVLDIDGVDRPRLRGEVIRAAEWLDEARRTVGVLSTPVAELDAKLAAAEKAVSAARTLLAVARAAR